MSKIRGLVKFDFLGLKTLSVLQQGGRPARRSAASTVDLDALPLGRSGRSTSCCKRGDTVGVFQLESEGMRRTLAAVKPTNFGDIIALVSLYRPGPMDNIPLFGQRKNGLSADRISASQARRHPGRNLRHLRLSGTGDAGRADAGRLFARRCRPAAPRDGQEDPGGNGRAARPLRRWLQGESPASRRRRPTSCST